MWKYISDTATGVKTTVLDWIPIILCYDSSSILRQAISLSNNVLLIWTQGTETHFGEMLSRKGILRSRLQNNGHLVQRSICLEFMIFSRTT